MHLTIKKVRLQHDFLGIGDFCAVFLFISLKFLDNLGHIFDYINRIALSGRKNKLYIFSSTLCEIVFIEKSFKLINLHYVAS